MVSKQPLVSIVVPIYNVAPYLPRCLDSILSQTYKNFEAILVNDGSTDDSRKICEEYARKDKRLILTNKKNGGLSSARNAGIEKASGSYITFVDSDDYIDDDYVSTLLETATKYGSDISACGHITRYERSSATIHSACNRDFSLSPEEAIKAILYETYSGLGVSAWAKLYSTKLFNNVRFPEGALYEDTAVIFELVSLANKVGANLIGKYNYIMRDNSIVNERFTNKKLELISSTESGCNKVLPKYPKLKRAVNCRIVYAYLSTLSQASKSSTKPPKSITKKLISYIRRHGLPLLFNANVKTRNKIGVLSSLFGFRFYTFSWKMYSKMTGRKV